MRVRAIFAATLLILGGCDLPRDSHDSLLRAKRGEPLRVGVIDNAPWATVAGGEVSGLEVDLARDWARREGLRLRFVAGPKVELVEQLHGRELDLLVGGLTKSAPEKGKLAPTQPYLKTTLAASAPGKAEAHVLSVSQGESALLLSLDRYLASLDEAALVARLAR